jgi:hypothetical protein
VRNCRATLLFHGSSLTTDSRHSQFQLIHPGAQLAPRIAAPPWLAVLPKPVIPKLHGVVADWGLQERPAA